MQKNKTSPPLWDGKIRGTTQIAPSAAPLESLNAGNAAPLRCGARGRLPAQQPQKPFTLGFPLFCGVIALFCPSMPLPIPLKILFQYKPAS